MFLARYAWLGLFGGIAPRIKVRNGSDGRLEIFFLVCLSISSFQNNVKKNLTLFFYKILNKKQKKNRNNNDYKLVNKNVNEEDNEDDNLNDVYLGKKKLKLLIKNGPEK